MPFLFLALTPFCFFALFQLFQAVFAELPVPVRLAPIYYPAAAIANHDGTPCLASAPRQAFFYSFEHVAPQMGVSASLQIPSKTEVISNTSFFFAAKLRDGRDEDVQKCTFAHLSAPFGLSVRTFQAPYAHRSPLPLRIRTAFLPPQAMPSSIFSFFSYLYNLLVSPGQSSLFFTGNTCPVRIAKCPDGWIFQKKRMVEAAFFANIAYH